MPGSVKSFILPINVKSRMLYGTVSQEYRTLCKDRQKSIAVNYMTREKYTGKHITLTFKENEYLLPSRFITLKSSDVALGVRPGLFSEP